MGVIARHGGPYDRGSADYYYNRSYDPHYYEGSTYMSKRIEAEDMTKEQIDEYFKGWSEEHDRKIW